MKKIIRSLKILLWKIQKEIMTSSDYVVYLRKRGVKVGEKVNFRYPAHTMIDLTRPSLIEIGNNVDINDHFTILTHDFGTFVFRNKYKDFVNSEARVKIGDNIVFGRNVTILKGVSIGNNCIIALGSVITKSIPENSVVAGIPARVICTLDEYYEKRKKQQVKEAIDFGVSIIQRYNREPKIEDFEEEWVLFLNKSEYEQNSIVKGYVDFRLKNEIDIKEFLNRKKEFDGFNSFLIAIKESYKSFSK